MEWSNKMVMEFLHHYENEPVIWDLKHENHKKKCLLYEAWQRIKFNISWECGIEDLKRKKDSLMAYYRIHKNKINKTKYSDNEEDEYKTTWFAFDAMDGFLGHLYDGPATTEAEEMDAIRKFQKKEFVNCGISSSASPSSKVIRKRRETINVSDNRNSSSHKTKVLEKQTEDDHLPATLHRTTPGNEKKITECELYGQLLAHKLMKLGEDDRVIVMHKIDNLLFDAIMQTKVKG